MKKIALSKETLLRLTQDQSGLVKAGLQPTFPVSACNDTCPDTVNLNKCRDTNGCNTAQIGCESVLACTQGIKCF